MRRAALLLALTACVPAPDGEPTRIASVQLLAVRADPPETTPGDGPTRFTALVASPDGAVTQATVRWAFCALPRSPLDTTATPAGCLDDGPALSALAADGLAVTGAIPGDACRTVGPELPPLGGSTRAQRPPDPDVTGGYYLPLRVTLDEPGAYEVAFARLRIACARPDVPSDVARAFALRNTPNRNPEIVSLTRDGATFTVTVTPASVERYPRIERDGARVVDDDEHLAVSWFTNAGRFAHARDGIERGATQATNTLTVDEGARRATVWAVVRDGRGGVAFAVWEAPPTR